MLHVCVSSRYVCGSFTPLDSFVKRQASFVSKSVEYGGIGVTFNSSGAVHFILYYTVLVFSRCALCRSVYVISLPLFNYV